LFDEVKEGKLTECSQVDRLSDWRCCTSRHIYYPSFWWMRVSCRKSRKGSSFFSTFHSLEASRPPPLKPSRARIVAYHSTYATPAFVSPSSARLRLRRIEFLPPRNHNSASLFRNDATVCRLDHSGGIAAAHFSPLASSLAETHLPLGFPHLLAVKSPLLRSLGLSRR